MPILAIYRQHVYFGAVMKEINVKIPDPKELEKELGEFLTKKFGANVKLATPIILPQENTSDPTGGSAGKTVDVNFDLKPEELVAYLDQYIIKQDAAKAILATKICTHFNRIRFRRSARNEISEMVGGIKNNILMLGPTGVGKTYMVRLIAHKLGVPFVKGDATKFSETGYVGGDVEDLVRDLVREADGDIERAQFGIIYIDEIDKIASAHNAVGIDVSRTGVQRALLKPMEETEVDLKVPHDPISMLQEIEQFRKTGKRDRSAVNTRNILFIMSGAFSGLDAIIKKRLSQKNIGFGASIGKPYADSELLPKVKSEDLVAYGFESEFVGRLPVKAVFDRLTEDDLFEILNNPNNPIILGKKLDFRAYGIEIKFARETLRYFALKAFDENTGARGLVSSVEEGLLPFEKRLPSTKLKRMAATVDLLSNPAEGLSRLENSIEASSEQMTFDQTAEEETATVVSYISHNKTRLEKTYGLPITSKRTDLMAYYYGHHTVDIEGVFKAFTYFYEQVKIMEMRFLKNDAMSIVFEEDAIDLFIDRWLRQEIDLDSIYNQISADFQLGLKLVREKTSRNRFFISRQAIEAPEEFIRMLLMEKVSESADNEGLEKGNDA
jgi:ATP-dependent Clp protease ATP-binding subunit ClpX